MRRAVPAMVMLGVLCPVAAGCGSTGPAPGPAPAQTTGTTTTSSSQVYRGTSSQGQPVTVAVNGGSVLAQMRFALSCGDGSSTTATLYSRPARPRLRPDGSFYYQERGHQAKNAFPGYGAGHYRGAIAGTIARGTAQGTAAFRISFKETQCRASVRWTARPR